MRCFYGNRVKRHFFSIFLPPYMKHSCKLWNSKNLFHCPIVKKSVDSMSFNPVCNF